MTNRVKVINMRYYSKRDFVRVDRATKWGNPFRVGIDGNRDEVIEKYRQDLWERIKAGKVLIRELAELADKQLGCWCIPKRCHAEVLAQAAIWAKGIKND